MIEQFVFETLWTVALLVALPLGVATASGFLITLLQAAFQLQEQTLPFVVKLTSVGLVILIGSEWACDHLIKFFERITLFIPSISKL